MRALSLVLTILIGLAAPARAADDAAMAQSTIRSQVEAMGRDDAAAAYDFASPAIQSLFPDPDAFMNMVRNSYAPVYRHKSFQFGESRAADGIVIQKADIIDDNGVAWTALYTLQVQPDGSLKIAGCALVRVGLGV